MKLLKKIAMLVTSLALLSPFAANSAIVTFPALDVQDFGSDTGLTVTATTLDIDATVFQIILDNLNLPTSVQDIPDVAFTLTATGFSSTFTPTGASFAFIDGEYTGSFTIGSLLSGTFASLTISGPVSQPSISAAVTYTGGSLQGNLTGGQLELATSGNGGGVAGKLGAVVPVPAAAWLFGSGLLGLVGIARRRA